VPDIRLEDLQKSIVVRPITIEDYEQIALLQQNSFIFTLQLLSFLPQERPGESIQKMTGFTSLYIELFQRLAIHYEDLS
jgi:hypothetical protein